MRLTEKIVTTAEPEKRFKKLFDSGGLYLGVYPSGSKVWRQKYRYAGKEKTLTQKLKRDISDRNITDPQDDRLLKLYIAAIKEALMKEAKK